MINTPGILRYSIAVALCFAGFSSLTGLGVAQETVNDQQFPPATSDELSDNAERELPEAETDAAKPAGEQARDLAEDARGKIDEVAASIDQDPRAQDAAAGILQPIYMLAEYLSFSAFYWVAFMLMAAGVINFTFQLVLGKLFVLFKGSLNIPEILSDCIGLIISLLGLILTTQAATQNSTFTQSPASVLSATVAGAVVGLLMYRWGQSLELRAADGQRMANARTRR